MTATTPDPDCGTRLPAAPAKTGKNAPADESPFDVPGWLHFLGGVVHRHPRFWKWLADLESSRLSERLEQVAIVAPVFVCGLARSGTTLLHEILASHPAVATHRIKDYPMVFTPYWWRRATANVPAQAPRERTHRDGVMITTESPDSIEEMLWMAFFPRCHDPRISNVLGAEERHPAFETFYRNHIRKLLLVEHATRYAAKANYHVARLAYLAHLFPGARFLIAVRSPEGHIASLQRQHEWFCQGHRRWPRSLAFMQRSGHYEFGLDRRPINLGDTWQVEQIIDDWSAGEELRGLARYWSMVYSHLARLLAADERVRAASLTVRFETLCESPSETLRAVLAHCDLADDPSILEKHVPRIRHPAYYARSFSPEDRHVIDEATAETARLWDY